MFDKILEGLGKVAGGDFASNFIANAITSKVLGGDTKDALMITALQKGLGSNGLNLGNLFDGGAETAKTDMASQFVPTAADKAISGKMGADALATRPNLAKVAKTAADLAPVFKQDENTLGYAKFLVDAGMLDPNSKMASLLNSRVGEALATSLVSGLGSKLFDKEEQLGTGMGSRPFGGGKDVNINMMRPFVTAANGGYIDGQYFPRRNGGIMPSEGSGQKDDVPAMLMAGEFVLTKDAVKGLGNGDSQRGIEKAYSMMNQLENKANNYV